MNVREEQVRQMTAIQEQLEQEKTYLSALRREFHRRPELSLQEFCTAARIEEELDRFGIPHTRVGETGVLGTLRGTRNGRQGSWSCGQTSMPCPFRREAERNTAPRRRA